MGFFSLLETLFFISLAITFILIMMLVYHFKGRLVVLEDKCNTMFEIMNSMVKEMKNIRDTTLDLQASIPLTAPLTAAAAAAPSMTPFGNMFPPELLQLFGSRPTSERFPSRDNNGYESEDDDDDDEDEDDNENGFKKIVVSDTELDEDEDDEDDVKIISVDISEPVDTEPLADLEDDLLDKIDIDVSEDVSVEAEVQDESKDTPDYKKMDVSYLRTMVMTRGLAMDTKKMKKPELIRLLEQSAE